MHNPRLIFWPNKPNKQLLKVNPTYNPPLTPHPLADQPKDDLLTCPPLLVKKNERENDFDLP